MYKGEPSLDYIKKLKTRLETERSAQNALDERMLQLYLQKHVISSHTPSNPNTPVAPVGAGIGPFLVDQKISVLRGQLTLQMIPRGGQGAEKIASDTLEPFAQAALSVTQEYESFEEPVRKDGAIYGDAWLLGPLPAPFYWGDDGMKEAIEKGGKKGADEYKEKHFPIICKFVSTRDVKAVKNDRGEPAEVIITRKMSCEDIRDRWGQDALPKRGMLGGSFKDGDEVEVCDYLNSTHIVTYTFYGKEAEIAHSYEHHMGCVPMVYFPFGRMPANPYGYTRKGFLFNAREIIQSIDDTMTDARTSIHENTIAKPVVYLNYEQRGNLEGWPTRMVVDDEETVNMLMGEKAERYPTPQLTGDAWQFLDRATSILGVTSIRESLAGEGPSGQSAVHLSIGFQAAQGELSEARDAMIRGYSRWFQLLLKSVIALNHAMPEGADDAVTIRAGNAQKGYKEIKVRPKDCEDWLHLCRASLNLNLPVNEGAAVQNASISMQSRVLDPYSARERFLNVANPSEVDDKWAEWDLTQDMVQLARALVQQRTQAVLQAQKALTDEQLGVASQSLPDFSKQALTQSYGNQNGAQALGNVARGLTSEARAGGGQQQSQLQGTNTAVPEAPVV